MVRIVILFLVLFCGTTAYSFSRYELACRSDMLEESYRVMLGELGTLERTEKGKARVYAYLRAVGLAKRNPYCAAGQYWCFLKASKKLMMQVSEIPLPRSGLASSFFHRAQSKGRRKAYIPKMHDLIIWRKGATIFGHVERIVLVRTGGWVESVGFNTKQVINGKEEKGVFMHRRNIYHPLGRLAIKGLVGFNTEQRDD